MSTQRPVALAPCSCSGCRFLLHLTLDQNLMGFGLLFLVDVPLPPHLGDCFAQIYLMARHATSWRWAWARWTWWVSEKQEIPRLQKVDGAAELCCFSVAYAWKSSARYCFILLWCQGPFPITHSNMHCVPSLNRCLEDLVFHNGLCKVPKVGNLKTDVQLIPHSCRK